VVNSAAELLHVLMLPDFERLDAIGAYWGALCLRSRDPRPSAGARAYDRCWAQVGGTILT
jgi:hypothetical protein